MVALYKGAIKGAAGSRNANYAVADFKMHNNMLQYNSWGIHSPDGIGSLALSLYTVNFSLLNNVMGGGSGAYPQSTTMISNEEYSQQFTGDFYLAQTSPFRGMATDGQDVGRVAVDVVDPEPTPTPTPTPTQDPEIAVLKSQIQTLTAQLQALTARVSATETKANTTEARLTALGNYISVIPNFSKAQLITNYFRAIPK
jgi:hypothetical protein